MTFLGRSVYCTQKTRLCEECSEDPHVVPQREHIDLGTNDFKSIRRYIIVGRTGQVFLLGVFLSKFAHVFVP